MSSFRRRLMMAAFAGGGGGSYNADSYIQDGLIFQLDAIDKGGDGTTWVDRKGGVIFDNHGAVLGLDYVEFDGSSYMQNLTEPNIGNWGTGATIEIAISSTLAGTQILFMQNQVTSADVPVAGFYASGTTFWYTTNGNGRNSPLLSQAPKLLSVSGSSAVADGTITTLTSAKDYWGIRAGNGICIGCRAPGVHHFVGKIHSIRIYSRELSTSEMQFNQQIDSARFNLELNI